MNLCARGQHKLGVSKKNKQRFEGESCKTTAERSALRNCHICLLHRSRDLKSM